MDGYIMDEVNVFVGLTGIMVCDYHGCSIWENKAILVAKWYKLLKTVCENVKEEYEWDAYMAEKVFEDYERRLVDEAKSYPDYNMALAFYFSKKREEA